MKPISFLKARSAEVLERLAEDRRPLLITQNGEAKAVLQDVASYEQQQEALALLKVLTLGSAQIEDGKTKPIRGVIEGMRQRLKTGR